MVMRYITVLLLCSLGLVGCGPSQTVILPSRYEHLIVSPPSEEDEARLREEGATRPAYLVSWRQPKVDDWSELPEPPIEVKVFFTVEPDGTATDLEFEGEVHPVLEAILTESIGSAKFRPALQDGQPVSVRWDQLFIFNQ